MGTERAHVRRAGSHGLARSAVCLIAFLVATGVGAASASQGAASHPAAAAVWSISSLRPPAAARLSDVACASATACKAVGTYGNDSTTSIPFIESWNGKSWSRERGPTPAGSWLNGVSCVSAQWCRAVGWAGNFADALVMSWDGQRWTAKRFAGLGVLDGVSCVSRTFCVAVGNRGSATLVQQWNGRIWSVVPSPNRGSEFDDLASVSCVSPAWCVAVGSWESTQVGGGEIERPLVEWWNGRVWTLVSSPGFAPDLDFVRLASVSCASVRMCVAVGDTADGAPHTHRIVEMWDGAHWTLVTGLPVLSSSFDTLAGVSCPSARFCRAVGSYVPAAGTARTLVEGWNGETWSIVASPNTTGASGLGRVSCPSTTSCQAIGVPSESYG